MSGWTDEEKWCREVPPCFHGSSETSLSPQPASPTRPPVKSLQPTSAVQWVSHICSALDRTCLAPVVDGAEPWKGVCSQGLARGASPSPQILPVIETHGSTSQESGYGGGGIGVGC